MLLLRASYNIYTLNKPAQQPHALATDAVTPRMHPNRLSGCCHMNDTKFGIIGLDGPASISTVTAQLARVCRAVAYKITIAAA
jgi:hypothetical protein